MSKWLLCKRSITPGLHKTCLSIKYTCCMSLTHWKLANLYKTNFQSHPSIQNAKDHRIWQTWNHNFASARPLSKGKQQTNWILKMWYSKCYIEIWRIRTGQGQKNDWKAKKTFKIWWEVSPRFFFERNSPQLTEITWWTDWWYNKEGCDNTRTRTQCSWFMVRVRVNPNPNANPKPISMKWIEWRELVEIKIYKRRNVTE